MSRSSVRVGVSAGRVYPMMRTCVCARVQSVCTPPAVPWTTSAASTFVLGSLGASSSSLLV
eukprot:2749760-Amphidinium_carterae.1